MTNKAGYSSNSIIHIINNEESLYFIDKRHSIADRFFGEGGYGIDAMLNYLSQVTGIA